VHSLLHQTVHQTLLSLRLGAFFPPFGEAAGSEVIYLKQILLCLFFISSLKEMAAFPGFLMKAQQF